jgi:hypothetical protein
MEVFEPATTRPLNIFFNVYQILRADQGENTKYNNQKSVSRAADRRENTDCKTQKTEEKSVARQQQ